MAISKGVILVGGPSRGTRFRPLSLDTPKPLFPLGGYPIIHHHVKALSQVPDLKEILLIGFFEESVFTPFLNEAKKSFPNINVRYLREYQALGTAGGLYHFRDQITSQNPEGFFVIHADVMSSFPLEQLKQFHNSKTNSVGTVMGTQVAKELATNFGCLVADEKTSEVLHYVEKPESFVSNLISTGIYYFSCSIFDYIGKARAGTLSNKSPDLEYVIENNDDKLRLEQDLLQPMAGSQTIYVFETAEPWIQITTASSALPANYLCLKQLAKSNPEIMAKSQEGGYEVTGEVFIHPTAKIDPSAKIGPNVFIGANVSIHSGSRVRDSLILDNVEIKNNSCVIHSIIGWDSKVGNWCRIEGSAPINGSYDLVTKNGIKTQSTTVLGRDVSVRDETIIRNCMVLPHKELKDSFHNEILM